MIFNSLKKYQNLRLPRRKETDGETQSPPNLNMEGMSRHVTQCV
jgi:hypothetical protein